MPLTEASGDSISPETGPQGPEVQVYGMKAVAETAQALRRKRVTVANFRFSRSRKAKEITPKTIAAEATEEEKEATTPTAIDEAQESWELNCSQCCKLSRRFDPLNPHFSEWDDVERGMTWDISRGGAFLLLSDLWQDRVRVYPFSRYR